MALSFRYLLYIGSHFTDYQQQGAFSEKDEQLRQLLVKLDNIDTAGALTSDDLTAIRRQLSEGQNLVRETVDRLRQSQEENEMVTRRRDELEARVAALESEYEELLGQSSVSCVLKSYKRTSLSRKNYS
jgi:chromosome segregation ATPase